ncbi:hypothetical protein NXS19_008172 [Fusarium pseudograminearum]|nr:hypothetical protein NXS19_008172 [Fusarium pseudograminearum]
MILSYSGVAWASKADFEHQHINLITSWPGSGCEEGKTPSEVYYEDGKITCGFEIDGDTDPIKWFKLLLLKEEDLPTELKSSEFILRARKMMRENDKTAIQDAGGGTVDLISYKIASVGPISLEEAVEGSGGLCGGIFIDQYFEVIIKNRLGRQWDRLSRVGSKELLRGEWELSIKPQFKPTSSDKEYLVSVPAEAFDKGKGLTDMSKEPHIKNGRIHFNESHIKKAFLKVFAQIDIPIDAQVRKAKEKGQSLTGIILVGGLGSSPYLLTIT